MVDPRARWPDGTLVDNPFRRGSFRWSLIAEWWYWEDDTAAVMAEIMCMTRRAVYMALRAVRDATGWQPPYRSDR